MFKVQSSKLIEIEHLSAGYDGKEVLHDINLTVYKDDYLGIIGPNGGGKTTLLKVILGLLKPYSGEVIYPVSRQNLFGYLPQNSRFDQRFPIDVTEVVLSGLMSEKGLYKSYTRAEKQKAWDLLDQYGMGAYKKAPIGDLSGGQMQRVAIARALVNNPAVILADEATGNLDSRTSFEILVLFQKLHAEGRTIIFVTHNPELSQYSSRNIRLRDGQVIEDTTNPKILSAAEALAALPKNDED